MFRGICNCLTCWSDGLGVVFYTSAPLNSDTALCYLRVRRGPPQFIFVRQTIVVGLDKATPTILYSPNADCVLHSPRDENKSLLARETRSQSRTTLISRFWQIFNCYRSDKWSRLQLSKEDWVFSRYSILQSSESSNNFKSQVNLNFMITFQSTNFYPNSCTYP